MPISKEKLESWYVPRTFENLTEKEEEVAEETICSLCNGTKEVDISGEVDDSRIVPCPQCRADYYEEDHNDQDHE